MNRLTILFAMAMAGLLLAGGCNKNDLSSPQGAAESFAKAMEAGDAESAKAASTGGDPKAIETMAKTIHTFKNLREAANSKFGDKGNILAGQGSAQGDLVNRLKDATVKIDADTATLTPKSGGGTTKLKKVDGNWKVDASEMKAELAVAGGLMETLTKAAQDTADDINAGKYKTAEEAKTAMDKKMLGAALGGELKNLGKKP